MVLEEWALPPALPPGGALGAMGIPLVGVPHPIPTMPTLPAVHLPMVRHPVLFAAAQGMAPPPPQPPPAMGSFLLPPARPIAQNFQPAPSVFEPKAIGQMVLTSAHLGQNPVPPPPPAESVVEGAEAPVPHEPGLKLLRVDRFAAAAAARVAAVEEYKRKNEAFLKAQREKLEQEAKEEKKKRELASIQANEGYFEPALGYNVSGGESRYVVVDTKALGVGVFSTVYPCANKDNKLIALKIIRYQDHFKKFAAQEVKILESVKSFMDKDPEGSNHVLVMQEHFVHTRPTGEQHLCMAFEHMYQNMRSAGKLPLDRLLSFSKQLLYGLRFLHESVGLVHCDVKPDNLLLRHDEQAVKLCDFGTARIPTDPGLQTQDELQPLFYRAPEVFMGAPRGRKIDVWSAGCTVYELVVGRILFRSCLTHREIVQKMMKLSGRIPPYIIEQGRLAKHYFSDKGFHPDNGEPVNPETNFSKASMSLEIGPFVDFGKISGGKKSAQDQAKDQLSRLIGGTCVGAAASKKRKVSMSEGDKRLHFLGHLIERCLDIDPKTRGTAAELCNHALFEGIDLPPAAELLEAPPLPEEAPPPLPPTPPPPTA